MKIPPVSFGSLMVFRLSKPGVQLPLKDEVSLSFPDSNGDGGNPELREYWLSSAPKYKEKIDGTVWNATKNFARKLDKEYKDEFRSNPKKVIFTTADFYVNPKDTVEKHFITAATEDDEKKIHKILSESSRYYVAKFGYKE